jgi:hypothetical protein
MGEAGKGGTGSEHHFVHESVQKPSMRLPTRADLFKLTPALQVREALDRAQARAGSEGRLIGLSAGLLGLSLILLAVTAPLGLALPGVLGNILPLLPLAVMVAGTVAGIMALIRIARATGENEEPALRAHLSHRSGPTISEPAVFAALGEAEDVGLKLGKDRDFSDVMSGRFSGIPVVVVSAGGAVFAVMKVPKAKAGSLHGPLLITPMARTWPGPLPATEPLTPLTPPHGLAIQAWGSTQIRALAQGLLEALSPAIALAADAGAIPHVALLDRTVVLAWPQQSNAGSDVAGATLLAGEVIKALPLSASAV